MTSPNRECARCGVAATDLPYENLGMTLTEAFEILFDHDSNNTVLCQGCAHDQDEPDRNAPATECCASGRCEVCSPGYDWGRDG